MTDTPDHQPPPRIPGVRYRTVKRTRKVWEETVPGEPRMVDQTYYEDVPVPPKDWDLIILRAVTGAAAGVTTVSVGWTTASIGGLLSSVSPDAVAYGAASVFDVAWLSCLGVEWLNRREPDKARAPRNAGWLGLVIAMGAVAAHGKLEAGWAVGIVGAAVSLLAKSLWTVVLRQYHVPLGERVGGWLQIRRQEIAAAGVVGQELRQLHAREAHHRALYGDAEAPPALDAGHLAPDVSGTVSAPAAAPVPPPVPPAPDPSGQPVPTSSGQPVQAPAAAPPAPAPAPPAAPVPPVAPIGQSIAGTIRAELASDPHITDDDLIDHVRAAHPNRDDAKLPGTVIRTRNREEEKARQARKKRGAS